MGDDNKTFRTELEVNRSFWHERKHDNTATEYASGDVIGTRERLTVRGSGGGGTDRVITVTSGENVQAALRIWFFRREPTLTLADDAAFAPNRNTFAKAAGYVDVVAADYVTYGTLEFAQKLAANVDFSCPEGFLWVIVEAQATITYAKASQLDINFGNWPD